MIPLRNSRSIWWIFVPVKVVTCSYQFEKWLLGLRNDALVLVNSARSFPIFSYSQVTPRWGSLESLVGNIPGSHHSLSWLPWGALTSMNDSTNVCQNLKSYLDTSIGNMKSTLTKNQCSKFRTLSLLYSTIVDWCTQDTLIPGSRNNGNTGTKTKLNVPAFTVRVRQLGIHESYTSLHWFRGRQRTAGLLWCCCRGNRTGYDRHQASPVPTARPARIR
jgi:hypothetical protein